MSYKSQLYPLSSTCETPLHLPIRGSWGAPPANSQDLKFLRSWLVYDSEIPTLAVSGHVNRSRLLGLALSVSISASFWAGIGLMIPRVWK